jgi:hypothetical protein
LTLGATIMLSLAAIAQSTPIQEQEKMSEPEQNTEIRNRSKEDGVGKAPDKTESTEATDAVPSKSKGKNRETVKQNEKINKPGKRSQADEDETGKKRKTRKENPD